MNAEPSPAPILFWSTFQPSLSATGGSLRTAQIFEWCEEAGFSPRPIKCVPVGIGSRLIAGIHAILGMRRAGLPVSWRRWSLAGFHAVNVSRALRDHVGPRILLWESTASAVPAWVARRGRFAVVALPQSLESLGGDRAGALRLKAEAERLSLANRIFCIAEEEGWLLANLGLPSAALPYYPPRERCRAREAVAAARARQSRRDAPWLVVGTAYYQPTREGMQRVLRWLEPAARAGTSVIVAGFGTEELAGEFPGIPFIFRGPVSDSDLTELLIKCRGLIVHQDRGGGSITRIPDSLLAGVPVLASRFASRDAEGLPGVQVYDTREDLLALLQKPEVGSFASPPVPVRARARFSACLQELAEQMGVAE